LPEKFEIFYAQKSNPHPKILEFIAGLGAGCDTASLGEMESAIKAGFPHEKIMMTGPGKTEEELGFAVKNKLLSVNVESIQELELLNSIAAQAGTVQDILVRINPGFEAGENNRIIGGAGVSKFGIDFEQIPLFFKELKSKKNVRLRGIHIFNSSQILDWKRISINTKNVIDTAIEISGEYNLTLTEIDLGGGFGIPYHTDEEELDIESLGQELKELFEEEHYLSFLKNVKLIFEPGRYLSGMCGIYLTKVLYTKESSGSNIAIIDGGIHHLIRPILIKHAHPIINLTALLEERQETGKYVVAGPLCTSLDQFDENAELNLVKPGDILAVLNAGAYGYTESMPYFLSHKPAKEIFI
jgi:diaminopimelate decarboxylase